MGRPDNSARQQELIWLEFSVVDPIGDRTTSLLSNLELDRSPRRLLHDEGTTGNTPSLCYLLCCSNFGCEVYVGVLGVAPLFLGTSRPTCAPTSEYAGCEDDTCAEFQETRSGINLTGGSFAP